MSMKNKLGLVEDSIVSSHQNDKSGKLSSNVFGISKQSITSRLNGISSNNVIKHFTR